MLESKMSNSDINIRDLHDEILFIDVLYSFVGVNEKFDRIVCEFTKIINYSSLQYGVVVPAAKPSTTKIGLVGCIFIISISGTVAILLGFDLGLGLLRRHSGSFSDFSMIPAYYILSAPIINCVYSGLSTCGCSTTKPVFLLSRIDTALANSWSCIAQLYANNLLALCGGFLVSYEYVVITVHCVIGVAASTELQLMLVIPKSSARRNG
jgi:hypothetical protein